MLPRKGFPEQEGRRRSMRATIVRLCAIIAVTASCLPAAEEFDRYARKARAEPGWEYPERACGNPGCGPCSCSDSDYAVNREGIPFLTGYDFAAIRIPEGHSIVDVWADVMGRFDANTTGKLLLRVRIPNLLEEVIDSPVFTSESECRWRMGGNKVITRLINWSPDLLQRLRLDVRRMKRDNTTPLRIKAFRIRVKTAPCGDFSLSGGPIEAPAAGGAFPMEIEAACPWEAAAAGPWVHVDPPAGTGSMTVTIIVDRNDGLTRRSDDVVFTSGGSSRPVSIGQCGRCPEHLGILGEPLQVEPEGGATSFTVAAAPGCPWSVSLETDSTVSDWISAAPASGIGRGTVQVQARRNDFNRPRSATIAVTGDCGPSKTTTIDQSICAVNGISPDRIHFDFEGGEACVAVQADADCFWTVTGDADWITDYSPIEGTGPGAVCFTIKANDNAIERIGHIRIGGKPVTVTQGPAPCALEVVPIHAVRDSEGRIIVPGEGGEITLRIDTLAGCSYEATSRVPWIRLCETDPAQGEVVFCVDANPCEAERVGAIEVKIPGGETEVVPVLQRAGACAPRVSTKKIFAGLDGGNFEVYVYAACSCPWEAYIEDPAGIPIPTPDSWVIIDPREGVGNDNVQIHVEPYEPGGMASLCGRTARAWIAGNLVVVQQAMVECLDMGAPFIRGDANLDLWVDLSDPIAVLDHLFSGKPIHCGDAADSNDDGNVDISDPIYLLSFLFGGGAMPPEPRFLTGEDPTADSLGCDEYPEIEM
jgi:hypothetical protein